MLTSGCLKACSAVSRFGLGQHAMSPGEELYRIINLDDALMKQ